MVQVRLRKTRERLEKASKVARNSIAGDIVNNAIAVTKDPFEFKDLGYNNQDIVDSGKLSKSFIKGVSGNKITILNTAENKGFRYPRKIRLGYNTKSGFKKGRPFYARAIQRTKIGQKYLKAVRNEGFKVQISRNDSDLF